MIFNGVEINGVKIIELEPREDERGYFTRVFCKKEFSEQDIDFSIKQVNHVFTKNKNTLRGLHFQIESGAESKVFRCIKGKIFDVVLDMRKNSSTFKKWIGVELSENNRKSIYIPEGCAHGYQTLVDNCEVEYFVSSFYQPECEKGIKWNDPVFNINWPFKNPILSEKDKNLPYFNE